MMSEDERPNLGFWDQTGVPITGNERKKGFIADWNPKLDSLRSIYATEAVAVIENYRTRGLVGLSTRAYAYKVAANLGKPHTQLKSIGDAIALARRAGWIEMDAVSDHRSDWTVPWTDDPDAAAQRLQNQLNALVADRQAGQPWRVVLDLEAAGMVPILDGVAADYGVPVVSGSGSNPLSLTHRLALDAVIEYRKTRRSTVVLVVTDFDVMGLRNIFVPMARDVEAFAHHYGAPRAITALRIAATPEQIEHYIPANLRQRGKPIDWWPADFYLPAAEALAEQLPGILIHYLDLFLPDQAAREAAIATEAERRKEAAALLDGLLRGDG